MTLDAEILTALRSTHGIETSAADLAQRLHCSRSAIRSHIEELRALGYEIVSDPHRGFRLASAPDLLHADEILSLLGPVEVVGRDLRVFRETTSTNDVAEKLARDDVREGVVVFAESQTRGRGRLGRTWVSPPGKGLWFSVLLRPDVPPQAVTQVTVAAATALSRAIRQQTDLPVEIKWPNDILIEGRKAAGILTELSAELDQVKHVVLGIGVNVNLNAADFPPEVRRLAISLKLAAGRLVRRADLAAEILRELDRDYRRMSRGEFAAVADEWEEQCTTLGRHVSIRWGDRRVTGRAESLDEDGALQLRTDHGHLERITGGDVTMEKQ